MTLPQSLRARVMAFGVVTMALVLGIGAWVTVRALSAAMQSDINTQNNQVLDDIAQQIADGLPPAAIPLPLGADGTDFMIIDENQQLVNASLLGANSSTEVVFAGELSADIEHLLNEGHAIEFGPTIVVADPLPTGFEGQTPTEFVINANDWFETSRTISSPNDGEITLIAFSPFGVIDRSVNRLALALTITVPILVLLGGLALWVAIGAALKPVRRISDEAKRIAPSNSGDRLPVPDANDEIADLTVTLNDMLDRLDTALTKQRQFVSDASHELRSPLSSVKGATELLAMNPANATANVARIQRGTRRLESVLDDLTRLADIDADTKRTSLDLEDLLRDEAAEHDDSDITIEVSTAAGLVVEAHETQLRRAVHNLLTNATRHAATAVNVSAASTPAGIEIHIDDDGEGVPAEARERIFERFVRLDEGRSRQSGGSGLGLAIVASIAGAHGATVSCHDSPLGGARFTLTLKNPGQP